MRSYTKLELNKTLKRLNGGKLTQISISV